MPDIATALTEAASSVAGFGASAEDFRGLSDAEILSFSEAIASLKRRVGAYEAHAAAEVARRSRRELGHDGLAARRGFSSAKKLIEDVTRVSGREASQLVALGTAMDEATATQELLDSGVSEIAGEAVELPWDAELSAAVAAGTISVDCAGALRRGIGAPGERVAADTLRDAVTRLLVETRELSADRVYRAARLERDLIDLTGVKARQQELYERGGFRLYPKANGMYGFAGEADPESAAILSAALDPLTSSRRGGPRFVDPEERAAAQAIVDDPRTTERITLDGLVELVRRGSGVDPQKMYGRMRPLVKILVTEEALRTGEGFGIIESSNTPVSPESVAGELCSGDSLEVTIAADGTPLDLGRTRRLYDRRQREALAARDGGCLWPACDQSPAMTEAHHTRQWKRDGGRTDLEDGVLLCRFHHMQLHNKGWEIQRRRGADGRTEFWLFPPAAVPERNPVLLESKSPLMKRLRRKPPEESHRSATASARPMAGAGAP